MGKNIICVDMNIIMNMMNTEKIKTPNTSNIDFNIRLGSTFRLDETSETWI